MSCQTDREDAVQKNTRPSVYITHALQPIIRVGKSGNVNDRAKITYIKIITYITLLSNYTIII